MVATVEKEAGGTREIQDPLKDCRRGGANLSDSLLPNQGDIPDGCHDSRVLVESQDCTVQQFLYVPQHRNPGLHVGTLHPFQLRQLFLTQGLQRLTS